MHASVVQLNLQRIANSDFLINIFKSKNRRSWSFQKKLKEPMVFMK